MAGYSGTPLVQKIGIKAGNRLLLRNDPPSFLTDLGRLPEGVATTDRVSGKVNVAVYFTDKRASLEKDFLRLAKAISPDGMLWVAWPKKASGKPTDLTEDIVRRVALQSGLVDVKVCAIDETWSGLKLVMRLKDRPAKKAAAMGARSEQKKKEQ